MKVCLKYIVSWKHLPSEEWVSRRNLGCEYWRPRLYIILSLRKALYACDIKPSDSVTRRLVTFLCFLVVVFYSYICSVLQQRLIWDSGWETPKTLPKGRLTKQGQTWIHLLFCSQTKSSFVVTLKERHVDVTLLLKNIPIEMIPSLFFLAHSVLFKSTAILAFLADAVCLCCLYRWAQLHRSSNPTFTIPSLFWFWWKCEACELINQRFIH